MKDTVFFHIPKTGGSSFVREAIAVIGEGNAENWTQSLKPETAGPLISGHVPYHYLHPFIEGRYSFTILRDPIERVWSFARYKEGMVGNNHHPADEFLFDEGVSATRQMWNREVTQLGGDFYTLKDQKPDMSRWLENAFIALESFDDVFFLEDPLHQQKLWAAAGLEWGGEVRHNVTPIDTELTDERMQRCLEITKWDRMFFNGAREQYMDWENAGTLEPGNSPPVHEGV